MKKPKKYKIVISKDALWDIKSTKKYILNTFKYREYAENFSKKIKKAIKGLDSFPKGYESTGYVIEGLNIYFKPYSTYLIFFVVEESTITVIRVLKDRMYWQAIIKKMQKISRYSRQKARFKKGIPWQHLRCQGIKIMFTSV